MVTRRSIEVAGQKIGQGYSCFIIAEAGVNHNGDLETALRLVDVAAECGADAVKFQTFNTEDGLTRDAPKADYQLRTTGDADSQYEMVKRLELTEDEFKSLMARSKEKHILFISTPFDHGSVSLLDRLNVEVFKIASGEIVNLPLLADVARRGKPMIVSTGMANIGEVETALQSIQSAGNNDYVLLHCVSNYPADPADVNLAAMETMSTAFGVSVGYSDHTTGIEIPLAAVAMGACLIEKHITLDKTMAGPDHEASLEPEEFARMVQGIRRVQSAIGNGRKEPAASEANTAAVARKSLVATNDISAGTTITQDLISVKRPGTGLPSSFLPHLIGRKSNCNITAGSLLSLDMLS